MTSQHKRQRVAFARTMLRTAFDEAKRVTEPTEAAFYLGQAQAWAEILADATEDQAAYAASLSRIADEARRLRFKVPIDPAMFRGIGRMV